MLMAEDEGRFGLMNTIRRCWAPKPLRPVVARQMVRESLYVFAAVCPQLGYVSALLVPYANSQMMTLFLAHVAAELADYFIAHSPGFRGRRIASEGESRSRLDF